MEKEKIDRQLWPDIIRTFAIYGVITLHTLTAYPSIMTPYVLKIFETSVPLFVMLSGALLLGKTESYILFFKKRSSKVLLPWVVWTLIYMLLFYVLEDEYVQTTFFSSEIINLSNWIKFFIVQFLTGLWFLPLIFGIYLITPALRIFVKNSKNIDIVYILAIWFILISLFPWIFSNAIFPDWLPLMIYTPIQFTGYFILGYLLINRKSERFKNIPSWYSIPILALIFILPISNFLEPATVLATAIIFVYLYSVSEKLNKNINPSVRNIINTIGKASLGIYVTHALVEYLLSRTTLFSTKANYYGIAYTFIIFSISLILVLVLQKTPIIKNIVS